MDTMCLYRRHNKGFYLTFEECKKLFFSDCFYCGAKPSNKHWHGNKKELLTLYTGIDRVDNRGQYTSDNVVPACGYCNLAKNNQSLEEFLDWVNALKTSYQKDG